MPFSNRIRLPLKITKPQFPTEMTVFRKANGVSKTISSVTRETMEGETDWMPAKWHRRAVIALQHDYVTIEGDTYLGQVTMEADYVIEWLSFLNYPTAPAKFKIQVTPFDASNSNCQTCQEAIQLELFDDTFPGSLDEDTTYTLNVAANDSICCYPATFSIVGIFNETYLSAATINQSGVVTINVTTNAPVANNVLLLTYRVTCPNGGYDEANVYANIAGSVDACLAPENVHTTGTTPDTASVAWTAPSPAPANGYIWDLFRADSPGFSEQSGTTASLHVDLAGLTPGTTYVIYIRSSCDGEVSNDVLETFITLPRNSNCGEYEVTYQIQPTDNPTVITITYVNCFGLLGNAYIVSPAITTTICVLETSPGVPINILTTYPALTDIEYLGPC